MNILYLNDKIVRMIDNFDFANDIPKIILFLENENQITNDTMMILAFLHQIGFDIVIFDPSGANSIDSLIHSNIYSNIRLDFMKYDLSFEETQKKEKKGFLKRFLK